MRRAKEHHRAVMAATAALGVLLGADEAPAQRMPGTDNQVASCTRNCDADCRAQGFGGGARVPRSMSIRMPGFCSNQPFIVCACTPAAPPPPPPPPSGPTPQQQAEAAVQSQGRVLLQACFAQLHAPPTAVTLHVRFAASGAVEQAVTVDLPPESPLGQCLQQGLRTMHIAPFEGAPVEVHTSLH